MIHTPTTNDPVVEASKLPGDLIMFGTLSTDILIEDEIWFVIGTSVATSRVNHSITMMKFNLVQLNNNDKHIHTTYQTMTERFKLVSRLNK